MIEMAQLSLTVDEACVVLSLARLGMLAAAGATAAEREALGVAAHIVAAHPDAYESARRKLNALGEWHDERYKSDTKGGN